MMPQLTLCRRERPKTGDVALPEDTAERAREWAEGEAQREKQRAEFVGRLQVVGKDPRATLGAQE